MFNFKYIKADPTTYLMQYKKGKIIREGVGLSFIYFIPTTSLVSIPVASTEAPFIFNEITCDFQAITIQGNVVYRVSNAQKLSTVMNFTIDSKTQRYVSEDPQKLEHRIVNHIQVATRALIQNLPLQKALVSSEQLVKVLKSKLIESQVLSDLGIDVVDFSILAIKPTPETAKALEAGVREELLKNADEAIYLRRNSAIEQERAVRENELKTELAVEAKQREIREAQMEAERSVKEKQNIIRREQMEADIGLEKERQSLVELAVDNAKKEADMKAYGIAKTMEAMSSADSRIIEAITQAGMNPEQLIASALRHLADNASKIGELNLSPDLMRELIRKK